MIVIETTFTIIDCIGDYYYYINNSESYPTSIYYIAIMVRDVRDHTFSSLDVFGRFEKGLYIWLKSATPWQFLQLFFGSFFDLSKDQLAGKLLILQLDWSSAAHWDLVGRPS